MYKILLWIDDNINHRLSSLYSKATGRTDGYFHHLSFRFCRWVLSLNKENQ
jgi:hypothetical protein